LCPATLNKRGEYFFKRPKLLKSTHPKRREIGDFFWGVGVELRGKVVIGIVGVVEAISCGWRGCGRFVVLMWPVEKVVLVRVMYGRLCENG